MLNPPISSLMVKVDSRYTLAILAGKRARQLVNGADEAIKCNSNKPIVIAINEINESKITYVRTKDVKNVRPFVSKNKFAANIKGILLAE